MEHGLIGELIIQLKKIYLIHSQKEFLPILFLSDYYSVHDSTMASISLYDFYPAGEKETLNHLFSNKRSEYLQTLTNFLSPLSNTQKIKLNYFLYKKISTTNHYGQKRNPDPNKPDDWGAFDSEIAQQLKDYYSQKKDDPETTAYNIYLFIYYSVNKKTPSYFSYGQKYQSDLDEFNEQVVCKYGVNSEPGKRAIMELAFKDDGTSNVFALCEYGDMLYYGSGDFISSPNYSEAIKIYEIAAGIRKTQNMETVCHPLALFSLSYIFYNYHRRGILKNIENIDYLDDFSEIERLELAIHYSKLSLSFLKNGATYNNLGVISASLTKKEREQYHLKAPSEYYQIAITHHYIYAYNNLAMSEVDLIEKDPENELTHLSKCIEYLTYAVQKHEPWSANWLGNFYLFGIVRNINKKYEQYIDLDKAKEYFLSAIQYHIDQNSAWAATNLLLYFPTIYEKNMDLLNHHLNICLTRGSSEILNIISKKYGMDCSDFLEKNKSDWTIFCANLKKTVLESFTYNR